MRCENLFEAMHMLFMDDERHVLHEDFVEGEFYTLGEEYKMRVEMVPTQPDGEPGWAATIYIDQTPKEETQDELWTELYNEIEANINMSNYTPGAKWILTRKEGVTH